MSPRLTAQELQDAKKRKREEEAQRQNESLELERRQKEEASVMAKRTQHEQEQYEIITTVAQSLYDEIDKLAKKAPAERITDLSLSMVNELIRDTKQFLANDPYLKGISVFEAAGDNPEYRDALLILGQLRAALRRFRANQPHFYSKL